MCNQLVIHSSTKGYLDHFIVLPFMNKGAIYVHEQVFVWTEVFNGFILSRDHTSEILSMPSKWLYQDQWPKFAAFSPTVLILYNFSILNKHVLSFICFNSNSSNKIQCWICLIYLLVTCTFSWMRCLFCVHFLTVAFLFFVWSFVGYHVLCRELHHH